MAQKHPALEPVESPEGLVGIAQTRREILPRKFNRFDHDHPRPFKINVIVLFRLLFDLWPTRGRRFVSHRPNRPGQDIAAVDRPPHCRALRTACFHRFRIRPHPLVGDGTGDCAIPGRLPGSHRQRRCGGILGCSPIDPGAGHQIPRTQPGHRLGQSRHRRIRRILPRGRMPFAVEILQGHLEGKTPEMRIEDLLAVLRGIGVARCRNPFAHVLSHRDPLRRHRASSCRRGPARSNDPCPSSAPPRRCRP